MEMSEESPLQTVFGTHPQVKIVETFVLHPDFDYNLTELADIDIDLLLKEEDVSEEVKRQVEVKL